MNSRGIYKGIIVPMGYFKKDNYPLLGDISELDILNQLVKDLNWYGIRHPDDDWDDPAFLGDSKTFLVNRYGVFFTNMELDEDELRKDYINIQKEPFRDKGIKSFNEIPELLKTL